MINRSSPVLSGTSPLRTRARSSSPSSGPSPSPSPLPGPTLSPYPDITWRNFHTQIRWFNLAVLLLTPLVALYGLCTTQLRAHTVLFSIAYYVFNMIGITAGYHRLWSHRSYNASLPLQYFLAVAGAGSVQGAIRWWARGHRSHHRYTDTDLDPYGAHHGLFYTHVGWMLVRPRTAPGKSDVRDLSRSAVVQWQRRHYFSLALAFGLLLPWALPALLWGDARGGFFVAGFVRLVAVHHSTFSVNSLAHYLGSTTYDDKHTPRDHVLTALLTLGEGYHNFHHQFPTDYRNAVRWYQYDPTKWFIRLCSLLGLARNLQRFPENEVRKGELTMRLKELRKVQQSLVWPRSSEELPVVSWETYKKESQTRPLVLISGFVHDVSAFLLPSSDSDEESRVHGHPGGRELIARAVGTDATAAFFGGTYDHSHAAHNLLTTMRVGALYGGLERHIDTALSPAQKIFVAVAEPTVPRPADPVPVANPNARWIEEEEEEEEEEEKED